jgi:hypothetical protein
MDSPMWSRIYSSFWQDFCNQQHRQYRVRKKRLRSWGRRNGEAEKSMLLSEKCQFYYFLMFTIYVSVSKKMHMPTYLRFSNVFL